MPSNMSNKLKQNLKSRIDDLFDDEKLYRVYSALGLEIDESIFDEEMVWATIRDPATIQYLDDDTSGHLLSARHVEKFRNYTKGVKLFFDGEWYINRDFDLKLRPEWVEIIEE